MAAQIPPECGPFMNALQFHEAAWRAAHQVPDPTNPTTFTFPIIAAVVCMAFAAELYIKSLAMLEHRNPKDGGHELDKLFDKLSDENRHSIAAQYQQRTGRSPDQLKGDMAKFGNAFHDWRYVYELSPEGIDVGRLSAFARAAYLTVRERAPDWPMSPAIHAHIVS